MKLLLNKCFFVIQFIAILNKCQMTSLSTFIVNTRPFTAKDYRNLLTSSTSRQIEKRSANLDAPDGICEREKISEQKCREYNSHFIKLIIMGGKFAVDAEFPHMVALGFLVDKGLYKFGCGGSLISETFVLTAAHCIYNPENFKVKLVRLGTVVAPTEPTKPTEYDIKIKRALPHKEYNREKKLHDIALIELGKTVYFSKKVQPLCLYTKEDTPDIMEIVGWGEINFDRERVSKLQKAVLSLSDQHECQKLYAKRLMIKVEECHICAGNHSVNFCKGDSGGPLLLRRDNTVHQVGIMIHGEKCGSKTPGLFARVSTYLNWIEKHVWK